MEKEVLNVIGKLKKNKNVVGVYLFGSRATGRENKHSDYDLAVILENASFEDRMEVEILSKEGIDIVVLNNANPLFILNALKYGKKIFERGEKGKAKRYELMRKFADVYYLLKRQGLVE